jgi:hypothetical protein
MSTLLLFSTISVINLLIAFAILFSREHYEQGWVVLTCTFTVVFITAFTIARSKSQK